MKNFILFITICLSSFHLNAQSSISIGDAIELALGNNFQVLIAGKNVEIADNNFSRGQAGFYRID